MSSQIEIAIVVYHHRATNTVLLQQRDTVMPGLWEFPGGKLEKEEEAVNAARREFLEETGLDISKMHLPSFTNFYFIQSLGKDTIKVHTFYCSDDQMFQPQLPNPQHPILWAPLERIPFPNINNKYQVLALTPGTYIAIKIAQQHIQQLGSKQ